MSQSITHAQFIKPYPQPALDGKLGLTADDLARVLQTRRDNILRKFKSSGLTNDKHEGFNFTQVRGKLESGPGRPTETYVFCETTCKYIVAMYNNQLGREYFVYLLKCEQFTREVAPKLIAEHEQMKKIIDKQAKQIASLKAPKITGKRKTKDKIVEIVKRIETRTDMFGEVEAYPILERIPYSELTEEEKKQYQISHTASVAKGLTSKLEELINDPLRAAKAQSITVETPRLNA